MLYVYVCYTIILIYVCIYWSYDTNASYCLNILALVLYLIIIGLSLFYTIFMGGMLSIGLLNKIINLPNVHKNIF